MSGHIVCSVEPARVSRRDIQQKAQPGIEITFAINGSKLGYKQFIPAAEIKAGGKDETRRRLRRIAAMAIDEVVAKLEMGGMFR